MLGRITALVTSAAVLCPGASAYAQMDPSIQAQGMVLMGQNQGYIDRANGRSTRPMQSRQQNIAVTCTKYLPVYKAQHGANHPKVVKLAGMCRRDGY